MPSDTDCGPVNFIQLLPSFYDTALTMEWTVDLCAANRSARIVPYWNGSPFPNFALEFLNLLPVGSPDANALQCYKDSIPMTKYSDQYYTVLASGASHPVDVCFDKDPQSTTRAAAQTQARSQPTQTDALLSKVSAWPMQLMSGSPKSA